MIDRLGRAMLLVAPSAAPVLLVDVVFALLTAGDFTVEVGLGAITAQALALGIGAALFAVARRFLVAGNGRGTGMALTGTGALCVAYLVGLVFVLLAAPVCDYGNGDACAYGTAYAPQPYASVRVVTSIAAAVAPVLVLVWLARETTLAWATRGRPLLRLPLSTRPFAVALATGGAAIAALATLHFPAAAVRLAGARTGSFSLRETTTQVYVHAGALAAFAILVAGASGVLALLAWRRTRPAQVRALGGAAVVTQFGWLVVALQEDPVRLARFGLHDVPVPPWFHLAQGVLVLTVLLATFVALATLLLAGRDR